MKTKYTSKYCIDVPNDKTVKQLKPEHIGRVCILKSLFNVTVAKDRYLTTNALFCIINLNGNDVQICPYNFSIGSMISFRVKAKDLILI